MREAPHVCLHCYEPVLCVATALGWVSHVRSRPRASCTWLCLDSYKEPRSGEERCPPARAPLFLKKVGSAVSGIAALRKRPLARRCGARDEGGNDTHDGDPHEEHNMGGLRVQRGMRTAHEDVIDMWQGIIDADDEREQREDDRSKENCRVLRGTFLLVLSRRWLLPSCWCLLVPLRWLSPLVRWLLGLAP